MLCLHTVRVQSCERFHNIRCQLPLLATLTALTAAVATTATFRTASSVHPAVASRPSTTNATCATGVYTYCHERAVS